MTLPHPVAPAGSRAFVLVLWFFLLPVMHMTTRAADAPPPAPTNELLRVRETPAVDPRLLDVRTLYQGSGFRPYADRQKWVERAGYLREQVLIAAGLWPLPERRPLNAVVHGQIDRGDYTVEKVFFQSYPGFYVTGNLYRPKGKAGPFPGILSPHGHWADGRFFSAKPAEVERQIKGGWEKDPIAAQYPLQARCANLAKLGCVVFHYDMVGYADADPEHFPHRATWTDLESDLHGLSVMGLQTWDSIRALDFLCSLPEVDQKRLACTGASGGATQTFMLMAVDARLAAAAPVCMISAGDHQGGCVCENASLLRLGTDNVELAATFAPKPFIHPTATGDWTKEFMEKGFPEIKATYNLMGADDDAEAVRYEAGHNYNLKSRQAVYDFFNRRFNLGHASPVLEEKFEPVAPKDLSVFDAGHPRPADSVDAATLKKQLIDAAAAQLKALEPTDSASLDRFRAVMLPALRHMTGADLPSADEVVSEPAGDVKGPGFGGRKLLLGRKGSPERVPAVLFVPADENQTTKPAFTWVTVVVTPQGKAGLLAADGSPGPMLATLLGRGHHVLAPDVFRTGELSKEPPPPATTPAEPAAKPVEFRYGYNRTTLGNRVHDILTAVAYASAVGGANSRVNLIGVGKAGPWCLLVRPLAGDSVHRFAAEVDGSDFNDVRSNTDESYLPASLRYGGLWPLAALNAPQELFVYGPGAAAASGWPARAYKASVYYELVVEAGADPTAVATWVTGHRRI